MKRILLLMVASAFLLSVSVAFGQIQTTLTFNGGYQGNDALGAGTGFYDGTINGVNVGPGYTSPGMICDDFIDHISGGDKWTAYSYQVSSLNAGNINNTLYGSLIGLTGYTQLAYLVNDMFANGVGHPDLQSSISQAIWYITANAVASGTITWSSLDSGAQTLVTYVQNNTLAALSTYTTLWVYTQPFDPPNQQEMWGQVPVPEGGAALMYLLLAGVTCFGAIFYSRRQSMMGV